MEALNDSSSIQFRIPRNSTGPEQHTCGRLSILTNTTVCPEKVFPFGRCKQSELGTSVGSLNFSIHQIDIHRRQTEG